MKSSIRREITAIAGPAIISNITTPLLAMVDVAIVGHIGSAVYIAAIAIGASMFSMLYWLFGFLRMGSSGPTALAYGAGNRRACDAVLYRALTVGLVIGCLLAALSHPIAAVLLRFMDADAATLPEARRYFLIAVTGAPATLGTYALSGWFLGMQNSRTPMWMALLTNVVNIAMSLTFVFGLGMKIEGVAAGSSVAQWVGFLFGLWRILRQYRPGRMPAREIFRLRDIRRFFSINTDIFLRTLCLVAVTVWFTRAGAKQGVTVLAANAILLQLFMFFSYFIDGFAYAGEALAGKYAGRRDAASLKNIIAMLLRTGFILAIAFSVVYALFGNSIVGLLTDRGEVVAMCAQYLPWAVCIPVAGTAAFVWDGILIGLTRTKIMLLSMAGATAVFFSVYFSCLTALGNHTLWLAFITYLAIRGIAEHLLYHLFKRRGRLTDRI